MAGVHERAERLHIDTAAQWRAWLDANHERADGVWVVTYKKATGRRQVDYAELVEDALCMGWIDSTARPVDDERSMIWFAPRRKGSVWAASNRERVERLEREGRMREPGRAVIERARADGSWSVLVPAERMEVPDDLAAALDEQPGSRERWDALGRSIRLQALTWVYTAKRPATRASRVATVAGRIHAGERPV